MKTFAKVLSLMLVVAMVCVLFASCAKTISGTYVAGGNLGDIAGANTSYTFSGSKVTVTVTTTFLGNASTTEYEGTYEITEAEDGSMTISMTFEDSDASTYEVTNKTFKEDKDAGTITIGLITYTKQ